ncbi:MAG: class I SAM-dependent methyltransferase [Candidatus Omnitrophica bacterium]|nr:class I SAM-dependent methyltransferase [Candidatus Omnitrophota bacterium]
MNAPTATLDLSKLQPSGVTERITRQMVTDLRGYWDPGGGLDPAKVTRVDCSLCGAPAPEEILFERERFPYRRCRDCGLVYPSPRPNREQLERQYRTGRFTSVFSQMYLPSAEYRMSTIFRERVCDLIRPRVPAGRLLDVGCGSGHFLKVADSHGYEVYGVEPNPAMVRFANEELGLSRIRSGTLQEASFPKEFFDVVTAWDVLEHVEDPGHLLGEIRRVLKPGGWVFAYTENFDSFNVFVTGLYSEIVAPDVHIRHYSPATFTREFEKAGFAIQSVHTRGLDLAHIRKTFGTYPEVFAGWNLPIPADAEEPFQEFINRADKGDNLRLYARKGL